ncbi:hypothetical protein P2318_25395 [Myxococcaceae bacterium GXIMD 01537]
MQINPGGRLGLQEIIGRDVEITRYWNVLSRQSLILAAERRIGKTHIVWKMHLTGREGFVTFYQDLESVHSLTELVRSLYRAVGEHLPKVGKLKAKAAELWTTIVPKRIGELELPRAEDNWKSLLSSAISDVLDVVDASHRVVLIWDEFPLMLYNLRRKEGTSSVIQLLDLLRRMRQEHGDRLRFLFTGSVGLHLVLRALRADGNANDSVNDTHPETVPPMQRQEAISLTCGLLKTLSPAPENHELLADEIFKLVGGFPYYIHHVVDQLSQLDRKAQTEDISSAIDNLIFADNDPADLHYYVERIETYYSKEEARTSFAILDYMAGQEKPVAVEELTVAILAGNPELSTNGILEACLLLREDHHLALVRQDSKRLYDFRWQLVKQWWKESRL